MTTIEILPIHSNEQIMYQARCGTIAATGLTPGQALDSTLQSLSGVGSTFVILQQFNPDEFFTQQQQTRLNELMEHFHQSQATGNPFCAVHKQELENLVEAEFKAAISRSAKIALQALPPQQ